jgi:glucose-6-phosphate 1-dehydrogenase
MNPTASDALVFFGATGDLAYKKIFPALQSMVKRGSLRVPVIGVAGRSWTSDQFRARARESLKEHGGFDSAAFDKLSQLLGYVGGDYHKPATFESVRKQLGSAQRPVFYLAIPPALFGVVVEQLGKAGCTKGARVIVEKPFGHDFGSAQELNRTLLSAFDESAIFRIDHYLGKRPVQNLVFFRFVNSFLEPIWNSKYVESVQITMSENIGVEGRGAFYDQTGVIRDVMQNHLFQVLANLTMEPPIRMDTESLRDEKVKLLKAVAPLAADDMVRGQFRGYRAEKGVAADSKVETFAAMRLLVNSSRWQGTPFYLRAGKNLPVSCTEVVVRLRRPPSLFPLCTVPANYFRFRIGPDMTIGLGATAMDPAERMCGRQVELQVKHHPTADEMDAYERLLGDAMAGDASSFAREDYVEEAWRIVDPALKAATPVYEYEPNTWGPSEVDQRVLPPGGWQNPVLAAGAGQEKSS